MASVAGRDYESLLSLLEAHDPETLISNIKTTCSQSEEKLAAAWALFEDLWKEMEKPPVLTSLAQLLGEPILSNAFKRYLKERYCYECWEFYIAARDFYLNYNFFEDAYARTGYFFSILIK